MQLKFYKYQGTGNDFIMIDNRGGEYSEIFQTEKISLLCDRHFGIGADGLIAIENHQELDFHMIYFNSDGSQSFCGNGSRCAVQFAKDLGVFDKDSVAFLSTDGVHQANLIENNWVELKMHDVQGIEKGGDYSFLNTGSPHYIQWVKDVNGVDVRQAGAAIRCNERFKQEGTNVNFVQRISKSQIYARTYERGVEDETFSCGTGVVACAIASFPETDQKTVKIQTKGGDLSVSFQKEGLAYKEVWLKGPAVFVYSGSIEI